MPNKHWLIAIIIMFLAVFLFPHWGIVFGADTWDDFINDDLTLQVYSDVVYTYEPKPDITIYELSLIMPIFFGGSSWYVGGLPPEAKRHFRLEK